MDPKRWELIERLYHEALEREPGKREAFLEEACGGDAEVRRQVKSLLAQEGRDHALLQTPAVDSTTEQLPETQADSRVRQRIGKYEIKSLLGRGGTGEVYLAEDPLAGRKVAIKLLLEKYAGDELARTRFIREARAASSLDHQNICTIYEVKEEEGGPIYIVMQYVEGENLAAKIKNGPLNVRQSIDIAIQAAEALAEAHSRGIVHRDITPRNIMVTPTGRVKVLDFGLAKPVAEAAESGDVTQPLLTRPGVAVGTPPYMSPEQACGKPVDRRSDLFSLGAVLYECLSGGRAFSGATPIEICAQVIQFNPPPPSGFNPHVPPELDVATLKALAKDPELRYRSAQDFIADLREIHNKPGEVNAAPARQIPSPSASGEKEVNRRRSLALGAVVVLLVGLTLALAYAWSSRESQETKMVATVRSLAVLPFKPIGAGEEDEYLGLGMADALITKLSNIREINIRPTSAVRKYDAPGQDPVAAGRELRVEAVLEGSVQMAGDRIRVTVQLVSVRDGAPLWAGKFDEQFTNIFAVQDRISEQVARALTPGGAGKELLTKRYTENSEAHQLYLKGRFFWNKRTVDGLKKGIVYFNEAVEKDPSYALAYVGLADSYSLLSDYGGLSPNEAYPQARRAAEKALALDERLTEAHAALGLIKTSYDWDWVGAEREYRRAIELNPNYETAHQWYAEYLSGMGRHQEAITEIRRAKEINPASLIINAVEVSVLCIAREYDQGVSQGRKALEMDPHFAEVYGYLKRCYDQKGMYREAIAAHQMQRKLAGLDAEETTALREAAAATSARVYWQKRLEQKAEESKLELSAGFEMAEILAQLGEKDQAFAWLERAYEKRSVMMMYLKSAPNLDPLRSDPRFADLLRRVGHTP